MKLHYKWPKVRAHGPMIRHYRGPVTDAPTLVRYKVKVHGSNLSIHVNRDGTWYPQSRKHVIGPTPNGFRDNFGFAQWSLGGPGEILAGTDFGRKACLSDITEPGDDAESITVYGEWIGPGINAGTACNLLPRKVWAIFGVAIHRSKGENLYEVNPPSIADMLPDALLDHPDIVLIPWHRWRDEKRAFVLDDYPSVEAARDSCQAEAECIGSRDPFIESEFGIIGPGEGLVAFALRPNTRALMGLTWKAKADAFSETSTVKRVTEKTDPGSRIRVETFVTGFITDHRIEKVWADITEGVTDPELGCPVADRVVNPMAWMGPMMVAIKSDIMSECSYELNDLMLSWADISKRVGGQVRIWLQKRVMPLDS
jgi:hypothetical protein